MGRNRWPFVCIVLCWIGIAFLYADNQATRRALHDAENELHQLRQQLQHIKDRPVTHIWPEPEKDEVGDDQRPIHKSR